MGWSLVCSSCRGRTPFNGSYPRFCCHCGADTAPPEGDEVAMPAFLSAKTKATDKIYRDTERGSEQRAELAAQMAGVPVSDMSDLKITNMNDRRDAEIAAIPIQNSVTQFMDQAKWNPFQGGQGVGWSGPVGTGPYPNSGAKFQTILREEHAKRTNYTASSDVPAAEIHNPLYRRRA